MTIAVNGNIVLTERVDHFVYDGNKIAARCTGAFEVGGDKITAWRDYFDVPRSTLWSSKGPRSAVSEG